MIFNARLPPTIHTTVMTALVTAAKNRTGSEVSTIFLEKERIETVKKCLESLTKETVDDRESVMTTAKESVDVIKNALKKASTTEKDVTAGHQVTLADAMAALEDVNIDAHAEGKGARDDDAQPAGAMMAHTEVANRFNKHHSGDGDDNAQKRRPNRGYQGGGKRTKFSNDQHEGVRPNHGQQHGYNRDGSSGGDAWKNKGGRARNDHSGRNRFFQ